MFPGDAVSPGSGAGRLRSMHDVDQALRVLRELEAAASHSLDRRGAMADIPPNNDSTPEAPVGGAAVLQALSDFNFDLFAAAVRLAHGN